jgi:hypothetical protein
MDFLKFFSLVRTAKLYFPSAWKLSEVDPFEGSLTSFNANIRRVVTLGGPKETTEIVQRTSPPDHWSPKFREMWLRQIDIERNDKLQLRKHIYINSWHLNDYESVAMWKLYGDGLAIVSNFERLCESLSSNSCAIYVGCVQYVDYDNDMSWPVPLSQFIQKHISLSHEQEVRAILWEYHESYIDFLDAQRQECDRRLPDPPTGVSLDCDLDRMIDHVVLSPTAPVWAVDVLRDYCKEALGKEVVLSTLRSTPHF